MIRSMTGFGAAEGRVGDMRVGVELRTVNHRFFTPSIKLPGALARWEGDVREALRARVARGHVTLFARSEREAAVAGGLRVDDAQLDAYLDAHERMTRRRGAHGVTVDFAGLLRLPGVLVEGEAAAPADEGTADELVAIVVAAAEALTAMRD